MKEDIPFWPFFFNRLFTITFPVMVLFAVWLASLVLRPQMTLMIRVSNVDTAAHIDMALAELANCTPDFYDAAKAAKTRAELFAAAEKSATKTDPAVYGDRAAQLHTLQLSYRHFKTYLGILKFAVEETENVKLTDLDAFCSNLGIVMTENPTDHSKHLELQ